MLSADSADRLERDIAAIKESFKLEMNALGLRNYLAESVFKLAAIVEELIVVSRVTRVIKASDRIFCPIKPPVSSSLEDKVKEALKREDDLR